MVPDMNKASIRYKWAVGHDKYLLVLKEMGLLMVFPKQGEGGNEGNKGVETFLAFCRNSR